MMVVSEHLIYIYQYSQSTLGCIFIDIHPLLHIHQSAEITIYQHDMGYFTLQSDTISIVPKKL